MDSQKKKFLLEKINQTLEKASFQAQKSRWAAKRFRGASRSQQGDRRYFENLADIAEESLDNLLELKKQMEKAPETPASRAQPPCYLEIESAAGKKSFFYIHELVKVEGLNFLTPASPLGQSVLNHRPGETVTYQISRDGETASFSVKLKMVA